MTGQSGNLGSLAGGRSLQRVALDYIAHVEAAERALDDEPPRLAFAVGQLAAAARDNAAFMGTVMTLLETLRPKAVPR